MFHLGRFVWCLGFRSCSCPTDRLKVAFVVEEVVRTVDWKVEDLMVGAMVEEEMVVGAMRAAAVRVVVARGWEEVETAVVVKAVGILAEEEMVKEGAEEVDLVVEREVAPKVVEERVKVGTVDKKVGELTAAAATGV
jgi:hypothetical protein